MAGKGGVEMIRRHLLSTSKVILGFGDCCRIEDPKQAFLFGLVGLIVQRADFFSQPDSDGAFKSVCLDIGQCVESGVDRAAVITLPDFGIE